jgi:hypothetical protein
MPVFFKETSFNHYFELNLMSLFRKLRETEKMHIPHSLKVVKVNIQRKFDNFSRQQLHHAMRNTFRDYKTCSEAGGWHFKRLLYETQ